MVINLTKYKNWVQANKDCITSQYWKDDFTFVRYAYDKITGKGVEQVYILTDENEIDKSDEIKRDIIKYAE